MYISQVGGKNKVPTPKGDASLKVNLVGPHPILLHFIGQMDFFQIAGSCLGRPREGLLDHGQTLALLMQNIILSPAPLYRIAEWAEPISAAALGLTEEEKKSINDDRVARSLEALASSRGGAMFFRLALRVIKQFEINVRRIHHDTTTVTFHGQYKSSVREPRIAHGFNKDHRPDLKQLVFGLNVSADGAVPISHSIHSGNRSDDSIHIGNLEGLRQVLGRDDFIYVADSKLCTRKNLGYISSYGGKFVTVLPRTRKEDAEFRKKLKESKAVRWRKLAVMENKRSFSGPPDIYWTSADGPNETSEGHRIVWLRSGLKMEIEAQARETSLLKAEADLFDLNARLNRGKLCDREAIAQKVRAVFEKRKCKGLLNVNILSEAKVKTQRLKRGRPKEGDPVKEVRELVFRLEVKRDKQALKAEARADGVFPLVTNLDKRRAGKKEVLEIYKYQPYVEKRHQLFKTELGVAPVYLKKPVRAAGLIHATYLAMILDALIERTIRRRMAELGIKELPILPEGRNSKTPTTARVLEMFSDAAWYEFERGEERVVFPIRLTELQKELLKLLDIDLSAYA